MGFTYKTLGTNRAKIQENTQRNKKRLFRWVKKRLSCKKHLTRHTRFLYASISKMGASFPFSAFSTAITRAVSSAAYRNAAADRLPG